jgi:small subunit ribosomal protein S21
LCHLCICEQSLKKEVIRLVEVKRKESESFESLLRRFNRKIQQSGVLLRARRIRFFESPKSRNLQKVAARRRAQIKAQKEELKKLGKPVKKFGRR